MEAKKEITEEVKAKIAELIEFCKKNKFIAELVGCWVWVSFDEKPEPEIRNTLKAAGFRWSRRRGKWAHNCGKPTRASKGNPWDKYDHRYVTAS